MIDRLSVFEINYKVQGWVVVMSEGASADSDAIPDSGLACLVLMLHLTGVAAEAEQTSHRLAGAMVDMSEIVRCARAFGLKARIVAKDWSRLNAAALPAIAECCGGNFLILGRVVDDKALVQEPRGVNWAIVIFAGACNVLSVAGLHYALYIYYVVRRPESSIPSIAFDLTADDAISFCPIIFVLLVRKCAPVVTGYALVLFLIFLSRIYLLMPNSIIGFDGPSMPMDSSSIILLLFGKLSGLGVIVVAPNILIYTFIKWIKELNGAGVNSDLSRARRMKDLRWHPFSPRFWVSMMAAALWVAQFSPAAAVDGPECEQIFRAPDDYHPQALLPREILPQGDLSGLSEPEQRNVRYYVNDKLQHGAEVPRTVWLLYVGSAPPQPQLSLILEEGPCEDRCRGVAVLPRKDRVHLQNFSYRKNYVVSFGDWNWTKVGGFYEMPSVTFSFMDENEQHLIDFFDVRRARQPLSWGSSEMKFVEVDRSEGMIDDTSGQDLNYAACFKDRLGGNREIPGIPRSGPRSE